MHVLKEWIQTLLPLSPRRPLRPALPVLPWKGIFLLLSFNKNYSVESQNLTSPQILILNFKEYNKLANVRSDGKNQRPGGV